MIIGESQQEHQSLFNFVHHFTYISIIIVLYIVQKILIQHIVSIKKDDEELTNIDNDSELIHFELFIDYKQLLFIVSIISNGIQLLLAQLFYYYLGIQLIHIFIFLSVINGITLWWLLVQLRRTSYRKSKLLLLLTQNLFIVPYILLTSDTITNFILQYILCGTFQSIGMLFGMAIGSIQFKDAFGEFKQQFYENTKKESLYQVIQFYFIYGILPFLSIFKSCKQLFEQNSTILYQLDLPYIFVIQWCQIRILTYFDESNLKTNWSSQSLKLSLAPFIYLIIYQIILYLKYVDLTNLSSVIQLNLSVFIISCSAACLSQIKLQKFIQEQRKWE